MNLYTFNFKKLFKKKGAAFFIFLILFLTIESSIYITFSRCITNPSILQIKTKMRLAKNSYTKSDILIFGDSSAAGAIQANKLKEHLGLSAFNFSLFGDATMASSYFILKNYLHYNGNPRYIILMNVYDFWYRGLEEKHIAQVLMTGFLEDMLKDTAFAIIFTNDKKHIKYLLDYALPSQRYKFEIKRCFASGNFIKYLKESYLRVKDADTGILLSRGSTFYRNSNYEAALKDLNTHKEFIAQSKFHISKINSYYLHRLIEEAKKRNIKIFICFPPALKEFYDAGIDNLYLQQYKAFIKNIADSYDNVTLLTDDFYIVNADKIAGDIDHILEEESMVYTKYIAERMKEFISD